MEPGQKLGLPAAIVIAGALVAVGLYFGLSDRGADTGGEQRTATSEISLRGIQPDDHIRGSADADVVMIEFSDTECPFCKSFDATARKIIEKYGPDGKVAWAYRHFPIVALHSKAPKEAEALECAAEAGGNEAFWAYSDKLYSSTNSNNSLDTGVYNASNDPPQGNTDAGQLSDFAFAVGMDKAAFEECLASGRYADRVARDTGEAGEAGGAGTPYVVFISKSEISKETRGLLDSLIPSVGPSTFTISADGKRVAMSGALPFDIVDQVIASILR